MAEIEKDLTDREDYKIALASIAWHLADYGGFVKYKSLEETVAIKTNLYNAIYDKLYKNRQITASEIKQIIDDSAS